MRAPSSPTGTGPCARYATSSGANSGPHVQRQHIFYGSLEVINTYLRVHPIPGVMDFFDYSAAGHGLTYENGVQTPAGVVSGTPAGGVTIDGQPDAVTGAGAVALPGFESVDGPQGALTMTQRLLTNNPDPGYHLVYRDGNVLGQNPCTGDDEELYGASGPQLNSTINNTDEAGRNMWGGGQYSNLFYERHDLLRGARPGRRPGRLAQMQAPLEVSLQGIELSEEPDGYARPKGASPVTLETRARLRGVHPGKRQRHPRRSARRALLQPARAVVGLPHDRLTGRQRKGGGLLEQPRLEGGRREPDQLG